MHVSGGKGRLVYRVGAFFMGRGWLRVGMCVFVWRRCIWTYKRIAAADAGTLLQWTRTTGTLFMMTQEQGLLLIVPPLKSK